LASNFRRFNDGIQVTPKVTSTANLAGELDFDTTSNKLNLNNGTITDHVVTEVDVATLTNKTLAVSLNAITSTPNTAAQFNFTTGNLESSATTTIELGYVHGVTSSIQTQLNSISGSAITSLTGDVTATGPGAAAATVVMVGGSSAANIHSAELLANAATNLNTSSTIVKRDSSGNFIIGTITATGIASSTSSDLTISSLNNNNIQLSPNGIGLVISNGGLEIVGTLLLNRSDDSTTTGTAATLTAFTNSYVKVTNGSLVSISGIPAGANGQVLTLTNGTGNSVVVNNEDISITAANRILTGTNSSITLNNNTSIQLIYDTGSSRWRISGSVGGPPSTFGSRGTPLNIVAGTGIVSPNMSTSAINQIVFVQGNGGPTVVTASPAIQAGTIVGQQMIIIGRSNTNTLEIDNQNGLVELNGNVVLGLGDMITLIFDGTSWSESSRS
jgi:hypothetical protein